MDKAARRYARWVLLAHVVLLVIVLLVVALAAQKLYGSARTQALEQARQTQELLARQTALGIQNYYETVSAVLQLIEPENEIPREPRGGAARRRPLDSVAFARFSGSIWESLRSRANLLFIVDPSDEMKVLKVIGSEPDAPQPAEITTIAASWIASVKRESVSKYLTPGPGGGVHLVCVPMRGPGGLMMVAVVPVSEMEKNLLRNVNRSASTGAMLVDHSGTFVSSSEPQAVGHKYTELKNPRTRKLAQRYITGGGAGTEIFDSSEQIGEVTLKPGMSTIQPIAVLGQRWFLIISSDLRDVDRLVMPIFKDAMIWAAVVMVAMTGILVSTAIQMIRSRVRMERFRHEIISRELEQAREIQLAWLPKNEDDPPNIDLCAINHPASHISGDFYNWFQLCDGRTCVVIGDVTGHGMAAAFLMATTQLLVRTTMPRVNDPGLCLEEVNRQLCVQVFNGQFVTMLIVALDLERETIEMASAGHPPPLLGEGSHFRPLEIEPQLVLGVECDSRYTTQRFELTRGSSLLLYTDGVPDALNSSGERFKVANLARSVHGKYTSAQAIADAVVNAVNEFRGASELADDLTLVAVQLQHAPASERSLVAAK